MEKNINIQTIQSLKYEYDLDTEGVVIEIYFFMCNFLIYVSIDLHNIIAPLLTREHIFYI